MKAEEAYKRALEVQEEQRKRYDQFIEDTVTEFEEKEVEKAANDGYTRAHFDMLSSGDAQAAAKKLNRDGFTVKIKKLTDTHQYRVYAIFDAPKTNQAIKSELPID